MKRTNSMEGAKAFPTLKCLQNQSAGANRTQKAFRYSYVIEGDTWDSEECLVKIAERPFAAGGMRWCVRANRTDGCSDIDSRSVVKVFKPDVIPKRLVITFYRYTELISNDTQKHVRRKRHISTRPSLKH